MFQQEQRSSCRSKEQASRVGREEQAEEEDWGGERAGTEPAGREAARHL